MATKTDINGDSRYAVADTPYYELAYVEYNGVTTDGNPPHAEGVIAIEDSENGYIAFCTDENFANLIVRALDAYNAEI